MNPQADDAIASAVQTLVTVLQRHVQPAHGREGQGQAANLATTSHHVQVAPAVQSGIQGPAVRQEMARFIQKLLCC